MGDTAVLEQRLERIEQQLEWLVKEQQAARRAREQWEELKQDLLNVGNDAFKSLVEELDDVAPFIRTGDFLQLFKRFLRNVPNITQTIILLEGLLDFWKDLRPVSKELFNDLLYFLDELDRKGYFEFFGELLKVLERIVTHFTVEDVKALGDNIVTILETVRSLTQPEMLNAVNNAISLYKGLDFEVHQEYSYWKLFREMNTPEMRQALGFLITFLKGITRNVAKQSNGTDKLGTLTNTN